jgi:hypothetical protein
MGRGRRASDQARAIAEGEFLQWGLVRARTARVVGCRRFHSFELMDEW